MTAFIFTLVDSALYNIIYYNRVFHFTLCPQDCSKDDSSAEEASNANPKELSKNNPLRRYIIHYRVTKYIELIFYVCFSFNLCQHDSCTRIHGNRTVKNTPIKLKRMLNNINLTSSFANRNIIPSD